jgi:hypothetical protein
MFLFQRLSMLGAAVISACLLVACASSALDRGTEMREIKLEIGVTAKKDVSRALGLPDNVKRDKEAKTEIWIYRSNHSGQGAMILIPIPISPTVFLMQPLSTGNTKAVASTQTLICVFDDQGTLIEVKNSEPPKDPEKPKESQ